MNYVFLDLETTGLNPDKDYITEVAAIKLKTMYSGGKEITEMQTYVSIPDGEVVSDFIANYTGITTELLLEKGKPIKFAMRMLEKLIDEDTVVVAQYAPFDLSFIEKHFKVNNFIDTRSMSYVARPFAKAGLKDLAAHYNVSLENHHQAMCDAEALKEIFFHLQNDLGASAPFLLNAVGSRKDRPVSYYPSATQTAFTVGSDGKLHVQREGGGEDEGK